MRQLAHLGSKMKNAVGAIMIAAVVFCANPAHAFVELNAFYFSDTMNTGTAATSNRMFLEATLGFMIDKGGRYFAGWAYASHTASDSPSGTAITYASTEMGPRFLIMIDKAKNWSFGFGYYLVTRAAYSAGTAEEWKGTALKADIGYNFNVSETYQLGARLNYSSATYVEKLVGGAYSTVSNSRAFIYPSLYMNWIW